MMFLRAKVALFFANGMRMLLVWSIKINKTKQKDFHFTTFACLKNEIFLGASS
jgi:hypothetical protein